MSDKPLQCRSSGAYAELQAKVQELEGENEDIREQKEELHDQYRGAIANAQHLQKKAEDKVKRLEEELEHLQGVEAGVLAFREMLNSTPPSPSRDFIINQLDIALARVVR